MVQRRAHAVRSVRSSAWARRARARLCPPFCNGPAEVKPQSRYPLAENSLLYGVGAGLVRPRPPPDGVRRGAGRPIYETRGLSADKVGSGLTWSIVPARDFASGGLVSVTRPKTLDLSSQAAA